jgi:sigma-B regulation protein RsbU (phosphoserine phosphatase)
MVDSQVMDMIASGLGRAQLFAERLGGNELDSTSSRTSESATVKSRARDRTRRESSVAGGMQPAKANLADVQVTFLSTLGVTDWDTVSTTISRSKSTRDLAALSAAIRGLRWAGL